MKKIILLLIGVCSIQSSLFSQITPNGNSGSAPTVYTNGTPNDQIYIWCAEGLATTSASLTATAPSGTGPWTFEWFYHNQVTSSWALYQTESGVSSTISNLPSDGYRVQIYDAGNALVGCYTAWVWNMNGDITVNQNIVNCDATNLSGAINANGSFTYYNPPPPESIITSGTDITVCFNATHTWVSDLAFYLVGPASCGSPTILLSPNPGANGQGTVCNSGDNVNNLCFTTTSTNILNVCNPAPATLSGTYGGYGAGAGTLINWAPLIGCNAAQGGWRVQIYDCIGADVGALTNATITFSNLESVCGSPTSISYNSGAINSPINDNSCSAATASIFQVPVSSAFSTPITINASTSYLWTSSPSVTIPNSSTSLTPSVTAIPTGTTWFYLTATVSYAGISCVYVDSIAFENTCCDAIADAGVDVSYCTGGSVQIGTSPIAGMSYSWQPTTGLDDPNSAQPTVTLTNLGATPTANNYTLTITDPLDVTCTDSDEVTVTVNPLPTVSAGIYSSPCENAANLELAGTPVGGTFSGTGVTGTSFNPSAGTQTITYDYTDLNGCSNSANTLITVTPQVTIEVTSENTICDTTLIWAEWSSFLPNPVIGTVNGTNGVTVTHSNGDLTATAQMYNGGLFPTEYNVPTNSTAIRNDLAGLVTFCFDTPVTNPQIALSSIGNPGNPIEINTSDPYTVVWIGIDMIYLNNQAFIGEEGFTIISFPGTHTCISLDFLQSETYMNLAIGIEDIQCQTEPLCEGESVNLTANGASAYTWSPSEGLSSTSGSTVTATPETTTTYTVVDANDIGCSTVGSITVIVIPVPVADAGDYAALCQDAADINLVGSPAGGVFSGNGVTGNDFNPSVGGNQTITYTYIDVNGCSDTDQTVIEVYALPNVSAGSDQTICAGSQITLSASGTTNYQWSNGVANGNSFTPPLGNSYYVVTGTNVEGCQQNDTLWITVLSQPIASAWSSSTTGYPTLIVDFENNSQFANTYYWTFGNGVSNTTYNLSSQSGIYDLPGTYYMTLVADNGYCTDIDSIQIIVIPFPDPIIHVPNVFTPNGDGNNDVFFIDTEFVEELDLLIFNRWGNTLYQSSSINHGWDGLQNGNEASEGVYFFRYKAVGINGSVVEGHGHLTLVR